MPGFLFNNVIFGPVNSRRLGVSLGINLLPVNSKLCNYNCIYCECGLTYTTTNESKGLPSRAIVKSKLEENLIKLQQNQNIPDSITFAGNGEPTLHPDFPGIIDDVIELRDKYMPDTRISILTNATTAGKPEIASALVKTDQCIMKLDAGSEEMYRLINRCNTDVKLTDIISNLMNFSGRLTLQTLFIRGKYNNVEVDNTKDPELSKWLAHLARIRPEKIMIYPIARATAIEGLEKISYAELKAIAAKVYEIGLNAEVYE